MSSDKTFEEALSGKIEVEKRAVEKELIDLGKMHGMRTSKNHNVKPFNFLKARRKKAIQKANRKKSR